MEEDKLIGLINTPETREQGFHQLVLLYQKPIYNIIRKMVISHDDADDLVQEVFVKVWQHLSAFKGNSNLFTWIYRIAVNESLQFLRKRKRFQLFQQQNNTDLEEKLLTEISPGTEEIELKLQKAILQLPDKQRVVFNLKYYEDLSYEQMAEITETSVGSLKASYHHAVKKIEEFLKS